MDDRVNARHRLPDALPCRQVALHPLRLAARRCVAREDAWPMAAWLKQPDHVASKVAASAGDQDIHRLAPMNRCLATIRVGSPYFTPRAPSWSPPRAGRAA